MKTTPRSKLQELVRLAPKPGQVGVLWFGQSGFALRFANATVVIDLFLSPNRDRLTPPLLMAGEGMGVDVIACTHEHLDHLDLEALRVMAAASPDAVVLVPSPLVEMVVGAGVASRRVIGLQPGHPFEICGLTIHGVPARHGVPAGDAYNFGKELSGGAVRFLGYVIDTVSTTVYHAGDTILYDELAGQLRQHHVGVAFLPINGRDKRRELLDTVGNLGPKEAAQLARSAAIPIVLPMHFDMFAANLGSPDELVREVLTDSACTVVVPALGRPFLLGL